MSLPVYPLFYKLASHHTLWYKFYTQRWGRSHLPDSKTWKQLFLRKEYMSQIFMGQYDPVVLLGHTKNVRAVFILPCAPLLFTSGFDSVVKLWHLHDPSASIGSSMPLGSTVRAIAADDKLLVAGTTAGFIHCWEASASQPLPHFFELNNAGFRLQEHQSPVSCLALDDTRIYSGSWDMTIRVWDRSVYHCVQVLQHTSWVWNLAPHGNTLSQRIWLTSIFGTQLPLLRLLWFSLLMLATHWGWHVVHQVTFYSPAGMMEPSTCFS